MANTAVRQSSRSDFMRQVMGNYLTTTSQPPSTAMSALVFNPSNEYHAMTATIKYDDYRMKGDDNAMFQPLLCFKMQLKC